LWNRLRREVWRSVRCVLQSLRYSLLETPALPPSARPLVESAATRGVAIGALRPPESSVFAARNAGVTAKRSSSCGIGCPFRVSNPRKYRPHWLDVPALPLALASTVRFFLHGSQWFTIKKTSRVLSSSSTFL
jgi:hypothetical protein